MIRLLGILFLCILLSAPFSWAELYSQYPFVDDFLAKQSAGIMGTILALSVTTVTFLISYLVEIERREKREVFTDSLGEIKDNILFMFIVFGLHLGLLAWTPTELSTLHHFLCALELLTFSSYIFALWELINAVFQIRRGVIK